MLKKVSFLLILGITVIFFSCKESIVDNPVVNQPPKTKIFLKPDSSISQQQSKLNIWWSGDDPDGVVIGFYFSWDGNNWTFTSQNDSLFSLQIGAVDTTFEFRISAVDDYANNVYDQVISRNGIDYGAEPFTDLNGDGIYNPGEPFTDIGNIDPEPAVLKIPIKNSAPVVEWNVLSTHPDTTFPAMSFGWDATDIDGNSSISFINIALNDSTDYVSIDGSIRKITIRTKDFENPNPLMEILIDGDPNNHPYDMSTGKAIKLPGLKYNSENIFYVQAVDISGAKSAWVNSTTQANSPRHWYVKKPKGKLLIVDDFLLTDNAPAFYYRMMDSLGLSEKFDVYDIKINKFPYLNTTFLETIKLFDCTFWYGDASHSSDLASAVVQSYTDNNGKVLFSLQFPQAIDLEQIQGYIPIQADTAFYVSQLVGGQVLKDTSNSGYPLLETTKSLSRLRAFNLNPLSVKPIYYFRSHSPPGYIGFLNNDRNKFFIGIPLHLANGIPGSVKNLLNKVLFEDFNLTK